MRTAIAAVIVAAVTGQAARTLAQQPAAQPDAARIRTALAAAVPAETARIQAEIVTARKRLAKNSDRTYKAKQAAAIKDLEAQLAEIKRTGLAVPRIPYDKIKTGDVGFVVNLPYHNSAPLEIELRQILDAENMLVAFGDHTWWLVAPTAGRVDGARFTLLQPVEIVGTKRYATAGGASNTVLVLKTIDLGRIQEQATR